VLVMPWYLAALAEAYDAADQGEDGAQVLAEAEALIESTGEGFYEAECQRLKGACLLAQEGKGQKANPWEDAEACFRQALATARRQQAKSLELRAAMSLARLWQSQDKRQEAYDLLTPVYSWFTEGFDTADLKDAKALLDELR
jgi:predicted ATPase